MITQGRLLTFNALAIFSKSALDIGLAFLPILSHNLSLLGPRKGFEKFLGRLVCCVLRIFSFSFNWYLSLIISVFLPKNNHSSFVFPDLISLIRSMNCSRVSGLACFIRSWSSLSLIGNGEETGFDLISDISNSLLYTKTNMNKK